MREIKESAYLYKDMDNYFMQQRICNSLNWYIRKAVIYKRGYYFFASLSIITPLVATFVHSIDSYAYADICNILLASLTTISSSLLALYRFKDRWKEYRETTEKLKSELIQYHMKCGIYKRADLKVLCQSIEALLREGNLEQLKIDEDLPMEEETNT